MSRLPIQPLSPEEQQHLAEQLYLLMDQQIKSYHKHRHMGENSSVSVELAQELMASLEYTIDLAGGLSPVRDAKTALQAGQALLMTTVEKANSLLSLVDATAPTWQTECRWEALQCLKRYLSAYDPLHLAHRSPDDLFYPLPVSVPESLQGVDLCLFYLNVLSLENQIMAAFPDEVLETLWNRLPTATLNQCEQVILNALGKAILSANGLVFTELERCRLQKRISPETIAGAATSLCQELALSQAAAHYFCTAAAQLTSRITSAADSCAFSAVFL